MTEPIPTLSLHQPWATLVIQGHKLVETRNWPPPAKLIGRRIGVHATRKVTAHRVEQSPSEDWRGIIQEYNAELEKRLSANWERNIPTGAMLGTVLLTDRRRVTSQQELPQSRRELLFGEYSTGRWLWMLRDPQPFKEPIPTRGNRRIWWWQPPEDLPPEHRRDPANAPTLF